MGLSWLEQELPSPVNHTMDQLNDALDESVRRIAADLRPSILDELGLVAAIEWHTQAFAARTGIRCTLPEELPQLDLDSERSTALYRILQEALTNVMRHAEAHRVRVDLEVTGGHLRLSIEDDGDGIPPEILATPRGFGIVGMRERVLAMGGGLEISSPSICSAPEPPAT